MRVPGFDAYLNMKFNEPGNRGRLSLADTSGWYGLASLAGCQRGANAGNQRGEPSRLKSLPVEATAFAECASSGSSCLNRKFPKPGNRGCLSLANTSRLVWARCAREFAKGDGKLCFDCRGRVKFRSASGSCTFLPSRRIAATKHDGEDDNRRPLDTIMDDVGEAM